MEKSLNFEYLWMPITFFLEKMCWLPTLLPHSDTGSPPIAVKYFIRNPRHTALLLLGPLWWWRLYSFKFTFLYSFSKVMESWRNDHGKSWNFISWSPWEPCKINFMVEICFNLRWRNTPEKKNTIIILFFWAINMNSPLQFKWSGLKSQHVYLVYIGRIKSKY